MRQNKLSRSLRAIAAAAVLSVAPVLFTASSASALAVNQTVCYGSNGLPVFNPPSQDGFEYCYTRSGGSGGSTGLVYCTITSTSSSCTPVQPLQG